MKYYVSDLNTIYRVNEKGKIEVYNITQKRFVPSIYVFIDTEWTEITEKEMNEMIRIKITEKERPDLRD